MEMQQSLVLNPMCDEDFSWAVDSQRDPMIGLCPSPSSDDSQSSFLNSTTKETDDKKKSSTYKHVPHREKPPHLVARRNARERRRVQAVNGVFAKLRKCVPIENRSKRLSKVKTLHKAIEYIAALRRLLAETDPKIKDRQENSANCAVAGTTVVNPSGDLLNDDNNNSNNNNNNNDTGNNDNNNNINIIINNNNNNSTTTTTTTDSSNCIESAESSPSNVGFTQIGEVSSTSSSSSFKQDLVAQTVSWTAPADQFAGGQDYPYLNSYPTYANVHSYQQETTYNCAPAYLYPTTPSGISPC